MQTAYQGISAAQAPDTSAFVDIKNNHTLLRYFQNLQQYFMYANNFGLALDDEDRPNSAQPQAYLRNLFVPPHLSEKHFHPEQIITLEKQRQNQNWLDVAQVLKEHPRLFILGDPGAGKSTLLSWLMLSLSYSGDNLTKMMIGERVPFLLVLRDLSLYQVKDWNSLWNIFLKNNEITEPLCKDQGIIDTLLENGQALLFFDGLDEVTQPQARQQLGQAVLEGINRYPRCGFVITSRLLGFDQKQWFGLEADRLYQSLAAFWVDKKTSNHQLANRFSPSISYWAEQSKKINKQKRDILKTISHQFLTEIPPIEVRQLDLWKDWLDFASVFEKSEIPVFYLAPFNKSQTQQFIENWYRQYLGKDNALSERIANLQQCIIGHNGLGHLARIPVLLNMICFIHSRRGRLPDGRAELYQRIAETYLTSLDRARGIKFRDRDFNYDYLDLSEWLGKLALKLQDNRKKNDQSLLIGQRQVKALLNEELSNRGMSPQQIKDEVDFILAYVAQRSGLFIPRGQNSNHKEQYGFAHLSFLEYFAAFALKQEAQIDTTCLTERQSTINLPWWNECWALFFEQLEHSRLTEKYLKELFENSLDFHESGSLKRVLLLAKIVMDSGVRLGIKVRQDKIKDLWIYYLVNANDWAKIFTEELEEFTALCELIWSERFDSWRIFVEQAKNSNTKAFSLTGSAIYDVSPLASLSQLTQIKLSNTNICDLSPLSDLNQLKLLSLPSTPISDLSPLAGLKQLSFLDLGNTPISDLSPLAKLNNLAVLILSNTAIRDLSPLAELNQLTVLILSLTDIIEFSPLARLNRLSTLYLRGTAISDLSPLAGLSQLTELQMSSTAISDLSPLAGLKQLSFLDLGNTPISDLSPLAELNHLTKLNLNTTAISNLEPLSGLSQLKELSLSGTAISDLTPMSGLSQLKELSLSGTAISDLTPLSGLSQLEELDLSGTAISDLTPLSGLSQLKELNLSGTAISDLTPLSGLSQLEELFLSMTSINDLTPLSKFNNLKFLSLPSKKIKGINFFNSKEVNLSFDN